MPTYSLWYAHRSEFSTYFLKVVKWLYKNRPEMEEYVYYASVIAADRGNLELKIWTDGVIAKKKKEKRHRLRAEGNGFRGTWVQ